MADKRRPVDDDDDDFGLRTPTKKPVTKATKRPAEPEPKKKAEPEPKKRAEPEPKAEAPAKTDSKREPKTDTGRRPRPAAEPARSTPAGKSKASMIIAGLVVVLAVGGGIAALMAGNPQPDALPTVTPAARPVEQPATAALGTTPLAPTRPDARPPETLAAPGEPVVLVPAQPAPAVTQPAPGLDELARRSPDHAAVARILEEYGAIFKLDPMNADDRLFQDFRERERREAELIERIHALGPAAIGALADMMLGVDVRQHQVFLAKALASFDHPDALAAVEKLLEQTKDVPLQTTLVRFLPETPAAAQGVARAITREQNPNLRSMLLREYARRVETDTTASSEVFRRAALEDPDPNVRSEAVTLIGRRGDPRDMDLMEQICRTEENLPIRQRAIVSYAETGKETSLGYLEQLARDVGAGLPVRASAVLAIGRVGGARAIAALDQLGQSDPDNEIRSRAVRLAASLRAREEAERNGQNEARVDDQPLNIAPEGQPIERR